MKSELTHRILVKRKQNLCFLCCRVSDCYQNEKRIDQSCKQLTVQSNLLLKQSQGWIHLIGQFNSALKVGYRFLLLNEIMSNRNWVM